MLLDVYLRVATDTGLGQSTENRASLIDLLNRGAKEMYDRLEANSIYREFTLSVPSDSLVTLPAAVAELRGMRLSVLEVPLNIFGMSSPRYVKDTWEYIWKDWRDVGESPILRTPTAVAALTLTGSVETTPVAVVISGQTGSAQRDEEEIVMSSSPKVTAKLFGPEIYNIACTALDRTSDITVKDSNGNTLAVLFSNSTETRYKIVDVSLFPWAYPFDGTNHLVDVLYKKTLPRLTKDSDKFPAGSGYDTAWYHAAMHHYYLSKNNKQQDAANALAAMLIAMNAVKSGAENQLDRKFTFGRNKYYDAIDNSITWDELRGHGYSGGWFTER